MARQPSDARVAAQTERRRRIHAFVSSANAAQDSRSTGLFASKLRQTFTKTDPDTSFRLGYLITTTPMLSTFVLVPQDGSFGGYLMTFLLSIVPAAGAGASYIMLRHRHDPHFYHNWQQNLERLLAGSETDMLTQETSDISKQRGVLLDGTTA